MTSLGFPALPSAVSSEFVFVMLHIGENLIDGVPVKVERKRVRRISMRIGLDGVVNLNVPKWGSSLRSAESFMRSKWKWIGKIRSEMASRAPENKTPVTGEEKAELLILLDVLNAKWAEKLNEGGVVWSVRKMTSLWGSCHVQKRRITYSLELSRVPEELVEYIVVHEMTHLQESSHGPRFYSLMDERLPDWRRRRRILNKRSFVKPSLPLRASNEETPPPACVKLVQGDFWDVLENK